MSETITKIECADFEALGPTSKRARMFEGFIIHTTDQLIQLGVEHDQQCCETWGALASEDNFAEFIGAEVLNLARVDRALNTKTLPEEGYDCGSAIFVNVNTTKGLLQFTVYNYHNGYYGHDAVVISKQLNVGELL